MDNITIEVDFFDKDDLSNNVLGYPFKEDIIEFYRENYSEEKGNQVLNAMNGLFRSNNSQFFTTFSDVSLLESNVITIINSEDLEVMEKAYKIDRLIKDEIERVLKLIFIEIEDECDLSFYSFIINSISDILELEVGILSYVYDMSRSRETEFSSFGKPDGDYRMTLANIISTYLDGSQVEIYNGLKSVGEEFYTKLDLLLDSITDEYTFDQTSFNVARDISKYFKLQPDFFKSEFLIKIIKRKELGKEFDYYVNLLAEEYSSKIGAQFDFVKLYDVVKALIISKNSASYTNESLRILLESSDVVNALNIDGKVTFIDYVINMYNDMRN